jgi:hypothetical protein
VLAVGARLAARTGFSSIPLYLIAGIVLGALAPPTLDEVLVTTLSEVGIVLLLFTLGLEYSALELASGLRSGARGGILDLALNFPPGFVVGLLMGWGLLGALVLGGITYVSSSGIVAKVVSDLGRVAKPETPGLLSLLVLEDLVMALYLPLVGVVLIGSGISTAIASAIVALTVVGLIFLLALLRRAPPGRACVVRVWRACRRARQHVCALGCKWSLEPRFGAETGRPAPYHWGWVTLPGSRRMHHAARRRAVRVGSPAHSRRVRESARERRRRTGRRDHIRRR